jgi:hypothetical protein
MSIYEDFIALHGHEPEWIELRRNNQHFETDLRCALAGHGGSFRELAFYGRNGVNTRIMLVLWKADVPVRPHRKIIQSQWKQQASLFVAAFGEDLDAFLRDAGFNAARLPEEFDVWRGGTESADVMARGRSWTRSYSVACAFALQCTLWRDARNERWARAEGHPEPLVLHRRIRREQVAAWIGGPEREVILTSEAIASLAQPYGSMADWRRHRARREMYI